jgi:hypothetical protein
MEYIHASVHVPILEFELHFYNILQNLGINPQVTLPLLQKEGINTANYPVFPPYVDSQMKPFLKSRKLDLDKIMH